MVDVVEAYSYKYSDDRRLKPMVMNILFLRNESCFCRFLFLFIFFSPVFNTEAKEPYSKTDGILLKLFEYQDYYGKYFDEFDADIYIKGNYSVKKKNILSRYAPDFLYLGKTGKNMFVESIIKVHFKQPDYFSHRIVAVNKANINMADIRKRVIQFLNNNTYNPKIIDGQILLPWTKGAAKYYRYECISQADTLSHIIYQIKVTPKEQSSQLVSGVFSVVDKRWTIHSYDIKGRWEFSEFEISTEFGYNSSAFLLPSKTTVYFKTNILGNETESRYSVRFEYISLKKYSGPEPKTVNYDLSNYFSTTFDSLPVVKDETFWEENRKISLTPEEEAQVMDLDSINTNETKNSMSNFREKFSDISKGIVTPRRFDYDDAQMSYSGLLNPFKLAYSKWNGLVYWQQFRFFKLYENGQGIQFNPNLGILFQRKQVYFNIPARWLFQPRKFGEINFNFGNRNQTYSSKFIKKIEEEGKSDSIQFEDLNLDYFRHFKMNLEGKYEITNGLIFKGGINYDWYIFIPKKNGENPVIVLENYKAFAPVVGLMWTPGQYYRFNGKRKEYLGSRFPTFSMEYVWGVNNFLGSDCDYSKIELDIQQKIPAGLMHSFQYYIGIGQFLNTRTVYFANFNYFQRRNFPESWKDPIGGVFHLLKDEWYDASDSYIQAHFMYEFPSTVLRLFRNVTKDIVKERLYFSQLYTPVRPFYTELGYGIGNFIGNAGVFVSLRHLKYESIGVKFAFELGR